MKVEYAKSGDAHVAYQVIGDGPIALLFIPDGPIPMDSFYELPQLARFLDRLGSFSRLLLFDRRGIGSSDPINPTAPPTLERWMEDAIAVLDATGTQRAALVGLAEGGLVATLLSATYPNRVSDLVLVNSTPGEESAAVAEFGQARAAHTRLDEEIATANLTLSAWAQYFAPSAVDDSLYLHWLDNAVRRSGSPGSRAALSESLHKTDVCSVLSTVRVPTLVVHRADNEYLPTQHGRYLAENILGARYVEVPGADHVPYLGETLPILDAIEEFLTGTKPQLKGKHVLSTVLFTDIASSTEQALRVGDRSWAQILDRHDELAHRQLDRFEGRFVKHTGDGILATFDGPARAVRCACALRDAAHELGLDIYAGLHTGEVEPRGDDVTGASVIIAARIRESASPGQVVVSRAVVDLTAGSGLRYEDMGERHLKGLPGRWRLFAADA